MRKINISQVKNWAAPLAIVAAVVLLFLVMKKAIFGVLEKLGLIKNQTDARQEAANASAVEASINAQYTRTPSTKIDADWQSIADTIYADLGKIFLLTNTGDAVYQLCRVQNDTDVLKLEQFFGKRKIGVFTFFDEPQTLAQVVKNRLGSGEIATINNNYLRKNIKFRF